MKETDKQNIKTNSRIVSFYKEFARFCGQSPHIFIVPKLLVKLVLVND